MDIVLPLDFKEFLILLNKSGVAKLALRNTKQAL